MCIRDRCTDCVPPREYRGCISKDLCNTSHACGSPAIDGYSHVEVYPSPNLNPNRYLRLRLSLSLTLTPTLTLTLTITLSLTLTLSLTQVDCLEASPTAKLYLELLARGTKLTPVHELQADYDGLGVRWGIGHNHPNWQACEAACVAHRPVSMSSRRGGPFSLSLIHI